MLEGFFVIESWRVESGNLTIRLVPDHFEEVLSCPVFTITINDVQDLQSCEAALLRRKGEFIAELEASDMVAAMFSEHDDKPALFRGRGVSIFRSPYSYEDMHRILRQKDEELSRCYAQLQDSRLTIERVERFVSEKIRRAKVKQELTTRDPTRLDREIDVLRRVLQQSRER